MGAGATREGGADFIPLDKRYVVLIMTAPCGRKRR